MEIVSEHFLFTEILGVDDDYLLDGCNENEIQVCAGSWRRLDESKSLWYFDPNPEWYE